ncbi:HBL/NHE enterotoxin family protein [Bacillus cereus group sp. Bc252]|uniref:HBL/NHE enterotoxin family protein n=1 Tax=Bacillus TaxID=1386 RepID=UPI000BF91E09|nr:MULTISPECIES: HBL/NHE enterotoxin family protein [Bacillus cereus group]MCU5209197.1 alpha-helical pore-forming toxin family protein [Bacillus paranthracis]MDA2164165.1 HBL/NHE enterotoxin family protein [Bacillus cereus group sp. Bc252]MDF9513341.1 HBL/NHE enterotoxin family protein [Bacillus paranthracis]MDF9672334.1 HBL/NHE enterotoxin family protein [Bacillus paranthracis]MDG1612055.1 HBL/NHE enterotoxin family protein [Bacillus paranthracis]
MNILYYPQKILTILTAGILTGYALFIPSAEAQSIQISTLDTNQQEIYSLRPSEFKYALGQTDSSLLVMQLYAENIQKQPDIHLEGIQMIQDNLRSDMICHQKIAKENANDWERVEKTILEASQNIIQFNIQFQSRYEQISMAIHQKQTGKLHSHIHDLFYLISQNKRKSDQLISLLQEFQSNIEADVMHFKKDVNMLMPIINSETGWVSDLQNQIDVNHEIIKKNKDILWDLISSGRANKDNLADVRTKIAEAEANIQKLKASLSGIQSDVAILTDTQNNMTDMVEVITSATRALQQLSTQWSIIQIKYEAVLNAIDDIDPEMFDWIQSDLTIAKKEWQDLNEYVEQLQQLYKNERG